MDGHLLAGSPVRSSSFGPVEVSFDCRVLAPRPWTLAQSTWADELAGRVPDGPILELCAGVGHIGLAAAVLSGRALVAVEADPVAARFAAANLAAAPVAAEVRTAPMERALSTGERFPIILADPPYLPSAEVEDWPEDPATAIDGGPDGLDLIGVCLDVGAEHLAAGGSMVLQVAGPDQAERAAALAADGPLSRCAVRVIDERRALLCLEHP